MSGAFLQEMAAGSHARVRAAKAALSEAALAERAQRAPAPPPLRLEGFDLIAELKLRSPASGRLAAGDADLVARVTGYAHAGAAAVSVLTEPSRFDGSLQHLAEAACALAPLAVPALRKDFLVDPYQVLEARAAGAGGVLIILRMLSRASIDELLACAREHGLFVLLEAFDAHDLELLQELAGAPVSGAPAPAGAATLLAGVNCRDLTTLEVVPGRLLELAPLLPRSLPGVAESGVTTAADARQVAAAGYQLALIGSALMQASDPAAHARALLAAGRAARQAA
jgi:indole-3-glycerol phosphate synthase